MLSHANISHNVEAIRRAVQLTDQDVVLGILPFFHSFGYSVTLWGVMTLGPSGVYHFNPLDARQIGKLVSGMAPPCCWEHQPSCVVTCAALTGAVC